MSNDEPPAARGDDAWKAEKKRIAQRNEAAYKRGREERAARDAAAHQRRIDAERREFASLPPQPGRSPGSDRS